MNGVYVLSRGALDPYAENGAFRYIHDEDGLDYFLWRPGLLTPEAEPWAGNWQTLEQTVDLSEPLINSSYVERTVESVACFRVIHHSR